MVQLMYLLGAVVASLGMLIFLRTLSSYRENEIETYELVRNARFMRAEYIRQLKKNDE